MTYDFLEKKGNHKLATSTLGKYISLSSNKCFIFYDGYIFSDFFNHSN